MCKGLGFRDYKALCGLFVVGRHLAKVSQRDRHCSSNPSVWVLPQAQIARFRVQWLPKFGTNLYPPFTLNPPDVYTPPSLYLILGGIYRTTRTLGGMGRILFLV